MVDPEKPDEHEAEDATVEAYAPPRGPGSGRVMLVVGLVVLVAVVVFAVALALR